MAPTPTSPARRRMLSASSPSLSAILMAASTTAPTVIPVRPTAVDGAQSSATSFAGSALLFGTVVPYTVRYIVRQEEDRERPTAAADLARRPGARRHQRRGTQPPGRRRTGRSARRTPVARPGREAGDPAVVERQARVRRRRPERPRRVRARRRDPRPTPVPAARRRARRRD